VTAAPDEPAPPESLDPYAPIAAAFDRLAQGGGGSPRVFTRGYHELVELVHRSIVQPGASVLELGVGDGDLLAALAPGLGVGVDVSPGMVAAARRRHPELRVERASAESIELGRTFDYVLLSDLLPYVDDLLELFRNVRRHSARDTRVVIHSYSQLWRPVLRVLELARIKSRTPVRNWVTQHDVVHLLELAGLEVVTMTRRILFPLRIPFLSAFLNGFVANLWVVRHLCLTFWIVARPSPVAERRQLSVSIVVPARDEAGMIERIVEETPELGTACELIFVEGHSRDGTREEIERQIDARPGRAIRLVAQTGNGKGDAVRLGFAQARNEVLMILDADLTVRPAELASFLEAIETGRAEFVNGSRLVYGLAPGAMRYLNLVGNKVFSIVFSALIDQRVKDTLCGTKALERRRYEQIASGRSYFGDFDPFGDFDLLLGAARLNLKVVDLPVRYHARSYGSTKISRFRHGFLLLQMALFAFWKLKVEIFRPPRRSSGRPDA
jgi:SAM-dependent methyltransferase